MTPGLPSRLETRVGIASTWVPTPKALDKPQFSPRIALGLLIDKTTTPNQYTILHPTSLFLYTRHTLHSQTGNFVSHLLLVHFADGNFREFSHARRCFYDFTSIEETTSMMDLILNNTNFCDETTCEIRELQFQHI